MFASFIHRDVCSSPAQDSYVLLSKLMTFLASRCAAASAASGDISCSKQGVTPLRTKASVVSVQKGELFHLLISGESCLIRFPTVWLPKNGSEAARRGS